MMDINLLTKVPSPGDDRAAMMRDLDIYTSTLTLTIFISTDVSSLFFRRSLEWEKKSFVGVKASRN
jgi:hypothetical protein